MSSRLRTICARALLGLGVSLSTLALSSAAFAGEIDESRELALPAAVHAPGRWGFDDARIAAGVLRTEFDDPRAGTAVRPLLVDCAAAANPASCADIDTVFRTSNSFTNAAPGPTGYWMLTVNNDKTFVERCEEQGPPDQAIAIGAPGTALVGIDVSASATGNRVDLDVDQIRFGNPCGSTAAPFAGFGAFWGRGNSTPIGYLNAEGTVTMFTTRLVRYEDGGGFHYARHWVYAIATWGGVKHFAAVHVFGIDGDEQGRRGAPQDNGVTSDWKWPYVDSWYYPGAQVAVFPAWSVGLSTLKPDVDARYAIDWQRLFEKAWPDMPASPIPIEAVAFANEVAGLVHLHTAVSDVYQTSASPGPPGVSVRVNGRARAVVNAGEPLQLAWRVDNALRIYSEWLAEDERCGFAAASGAWWADKPSGAATLRSGAEQSGCTYSIAVTAYSFSGHTTDAITVVVR